MHATGDGPVDAALKAIERATGVQVVLRKFEVRSVSAGEDAQGEALVYVEYNQRTYRGSSVSTNIVESATQAFLEVINRIELAQALDDAPAPRASRRPWSNKVLGVQAHAHTRNEIHLVQRQAGALGKGDGARALACAALRLLGVRRRARL